jgi:hypothetical protein
VNGENGYRNLESASNAIAYLLSVEIGSTTVKADVTHHRNDAITSAAAFVGIGITLCGSSHRIAGRMVGNRQPHRNELDTALRWQRQDSRIVTFRYNQECGLYATLSAFRSVQSIAVDSPPDGLALVVARYCS